MNKQIIQFLSELKENNYREWFQDNKQRYDALKAGFVDEVQQLINGIGLFDPSVAGLEAKDCLFRIYRDIRFSPDKTPYKTHFSAYIARGGRSSEYAGYYFHLEPGNCILSGGVWFPPAPLLKKLRSEIFTHIDEFVKIIEEPSFKKTFPELEGEVLKRNPAGYPDSAYNYIIRHKDFSVVSYKPDDFFYKEDWLSNSIEDYKKIYPLNDFLNYIVGDYYGEI